ncbi:hypothetical protein DFH09DRAFT_1075246 [Mycena vulgaris]|nr:hypothetical protein DFH09DRAFT_1075246 [Mycena vulgaris]
MSRALTSQLAAQSCRALKRYLSLSTRGSGGPRVRVKLSHCTGKTLRLGDVGNLATQRASAGLLKRAPGRCLIVNLDSAWERMQSCNNILIRASGTANPEGRRNVLGEAPFETQRMVVGDVFVIRVGGMCRSGGRKGSFESSRAWIRCAQVREHEGSGGAGCWFGLWCVDSDATQQVTKERELEESHTAEQWELRASGQNWLRCTVSASSVCRNSSVSQSRGWVVDSEERGGTRLSQRQTSDHRSRPLDHPTARNRQKWSKEKRDQKLF